MWCVFLAVFTPKLNVLCPIYIVEDNNQVGGSKKYCPFCKDIRFYGYYTWKLGVFAKISTKFHILQKSVRILWFSNQKSVLYQKSVHKSIRVAALRAHYKKWIQKPGSTFALNFLLHSAWKTPKRWLCYQRALLETNVWVIWALKCGIKNLKTVESSDVLFICELLHSGA